MNPKNSFFDTSIEFLKGIGAQRGELLREELGIATYGELLIHFPFRYEDRTVFHKISDLHRDLLYAQVRGRITAFALEGKGPKKRLTAQFTDGTGTMELIWFQGITWHQKNLQSQVDYVVFGKPALFGSKWSITHPEMDTLISGAAPFTGWQPVYPLTEKLRKKYVDSRLISRAVSGLLSQAYEHLEETLPSGLIRKFRLLPRKNAIVNIHIPSSDFLLQQAQRRLKFEELFYNQLKLLQNKIHLRRQLPGAVFDRALRLREFYLHQIPFPLTNAQTRVLREIRQDLRSGFQMSRLLQGDVGSGKTIVAFISALMAVDNGFQVCLMAPTEVLAGQHYRSLEKYASGLGMEIGLLMGSTPKKARETLHDRLRNGHMQLIVGTHALLEDEVRFHNLGLCIIDEQHRFGVAQRARLQQKNDRVIPHMLVMTATPIPRTLAMTLYGDLDQSVIDELPPGRKPVKTIHRYDAHRLSVFGFLKEELKKGRQVYVVYPLIEESEKMDLKDLMDGYESISRAFPGVPLSIVHGKMKSKDKQFEMQRFIRNETRIMVATTVIEVGVDVPNASVMVIENAERFGLAQLHQLRGRVGRGAEQSYCILMTSFKLSEDTRKRIETMCRTENGFEIAQTDLELRGPGDLMGTQQSGVIDLRLANLAQDGAILKAARDAVIELLGADPDLSDPENAPVKRHLNRLMHEGTNWSRIG